MRITRRVFRLNMRSILLLNRTASHTYLRVAVFVESWRFQLRTKLMMFLSFRALHVVLAGTWYGAVAFITLFLGPAVADVRPAGKPLMASLMKRKLHAFMASVGGLTVVTGLYLFWHLTSGNPDVAGTRAGISFSVGALTGFIALILGGSMIGRTVKKMGALAVRLASMPEGAERSA